MTQLRISPSPANISTHPFRFMRLRPLSVPIYSLSHQAFQTIAGQSIRHSSQHRSGPTRFISTTIAAAQPNIAGATATMETRIVKITSETPLGHSSGSSEIENWQVDMGGEAAMKSLQEAAVYLRTKDIPVAIPTETVYGLAADATRSAPVRGIYTAKGRPSDNPLIIHVSDLDMLRGLLAHNVTDGRDPIPERYQPLLERFWPGPLTILVPNPSPSKLAPEVTAGLPTVGVRMPKTPLARTLIKLAGVPLAAPSANASTRPSPTTAQHVKFDLDGRIELILDGGACDVGVESTVVDGLSDPPAVLRPGGVGIDELRTCPGWENVAKAYKDHGEDGKSAPRAPGMKYKHYSPKARVVLYEASYEAGSNGITLADAELACTMESVEKTSKKIGVIRTQRWKPAAGLPGSKMQLAASISDPDDQQTETSYEVFEGNLVDTQGSTIGEILDIDLGRDTRGIAQGLFSALRELDQRGADMIFVDGIDDEMDLAGAVMNRLRKAASEIRI